MNKSNNKIIIFLSFFLIPVFFNGCTASKQIVSAATAQEIAQAINNDRWVFVAENAMPAYGRSRNLSTGYSVNLRKDTLDVALPYFGKLNSPAGAMSGNPLDFQSKDFTLSKENRKEGEWLVTIRRPDNEVQSMIFTFFDNGSAQLNITMTNRTGINFSGKISPAGF